MSGAAPPYHRPPAKSLRSRMKDALSRIYFDDLPVKLLGDESRPPLDRIVRAGGKVPGRVDVLVLQSPDDRKGHVLAPGEIIDRTVEPAKPIYLRSVPRAKPAEAQAGAVAPVVLTSRAPRPPSFAGAPPLAPTAGGDPVIAQLGADPAERLAAVKKAERLRREEQQATAEAEAGERQEEDREQESALQDEDDDLRDSQDDQAS